MAKTVDQIRAQIAKLQEREKALLQREAVGVVARIKEAVAHYGITAEQIFGGSGAAVDSKKVAARKPTLKAPKAKVARTPRAPKVEAPADGASAARAPSPSKGVKIAAKYKDPDGNTWSGRGSQPRWLRAAIESGKKLEDFAVA